MKILALDDDEAILKVVKTILGLHGYEVDCADSALAAIEMLKGTKYDIVLFDYKMPEHDGIWFLQNAEIPRSTKAVLMTAHGRRELIERVFELGAAGYMIKPFTADDLLRHIEFHTAKRESGIFQVAGGENSGRPVPSIL